MGRFVNTINQQDSDRYSRLKQLGWDLNLLRSSMILVVGAGALGNEIIKNLALASVGTILVIDFDKIESHNLTRSVLFRGSDVGKGKAEVASRTAVDIEPLMKVRWFDTPIQHTLGLGVFRKVDVVLGAVDNLQTRRDLNRACIQSNTPFIDGGLFFLDGDVRTFLPPFDVCFDCTLTQEERSEGWRRWSCLRLSQDSVPAIGPTAPTVASMVGGLQAQLALKFIHQGHDNPYRMSVPNGIRIRFNGFADEYESWRLNRDSQCPTHMNTITIPETEIVLTNKGRDMKAGDFLQFTQGKLGPGSYLELGFDLVHGLSCLECGHCQPICRRIGEVTVAEALCPGCTASSCADCGLPVEESIAQSSEMVFSNYFTCSSCFHTNKLVLRDSLIVSRIEDGGPILDRSLAELTVPLWDILEAKDIDGETRMFLELSGDKCKVLGNVF